MLSLRNIAIAAAFLLPAVTFAQITEDPLRYVVTPESPGPNHEVTIQIEGVGGFLGEAQITWRQDGAVVRQGAGERSYTFRTGALGTRTAIAVSINSPTAGVFNRTFTFNPSVITLVWEADTTVPPFHRGKALYSPGSALKVLALPTVFSGASQVAPSSLTFQWQRNEEAVPEASGLGRNTYKLIGDQLQSQEIIGVDVYLGSTKVGRGEMVIPVQSPRLIFYQYDALQGPLYDAALPTTMALSGKELSVKAEPYYFSRDNKINNALTYEWQLNGENVTGPDSTRGILTLRQAGEGGGQALLSVSLQNFDSSRFVQAAEAVLQLTFGSSGGDTIGTFFGI